MTAATDDRVENAIAQLPLTLQESTAVVFERFTDCSALSNREIATLTTLLASSDYAGNTLLREWAWFLDALRSGALDRQGLADELAAFEQRSADGDDNLETYERQLRQFRNRQLLAILWRETGGQCTVADTLTDLSLLADTQIHASSRFALRELQRRFGDVRSADGELSQFIVLAMGKLGGSELNFSSDVDLIFLYTVDGSSDGERELAAQEYFGRLARRVVSLLDQSTADGFVYRVDTRLRPFGESGPPVMSFTALESYLLQHGRSWERYAYIKARVIFGDETSAQELLRSTITPFVYRRYLDYGVFESLREMKGLIEAEVARRELASNIKLGPGGIREIEFIVQSLQLVRGGSDHNLRTAQLQIALSHTIGQRGLDQRTVDDLFSAYHFLRRLENCLQALRDQQTHDLPVDEKDRERIALAMRHADWNSLAQELQEHRQRVIESFSKVAFRTTADLPLDDSGSEHDDRIALLWDSAAGVDEWVAVVAEINPVDTQALARTVHNFSILPASRQIDSIARRRLLRLLPSLLLLVRECDEPDVVLQRILDIVSKILRRSAYVALLNENPPVLKRLVDLCATSAYLAEEISRFPLLLDEMLDPRMYSAQLNRADLERELEARLSQVGELDSEARMNALAQFQRATLFRIAIADFSGNLPLMHVSDRLTELAEIVLKMALEVAWSDLVARHGEPSYVQDGSRLPAGFGVVSYGKLAGMEMSYNSDLDLVFLHDSRGSEQSTDGNKPLDNSMFFSRLVRRLVHFLTTQTSSGVLYEVDTRLRPSGRSGLLVTSVEAFERYQDENAWTWEHQALLRSRPVAGSAAVAREFERIRAETLRQRVRRDGLLQDVIEMRTKMREHLDHSDGDNFDLKQGDGGIGDIEFLVQYLVLKNAQLHPGVIHYPDNIRQLGTLAAAECLSEGEVRQLQQTYKEFRQRLHRLALDGKASLVPNREFAAERSLVRDIFARKMSA